LSVIVHAGPSSFKAQFKRADASGAAIAVILAQDELVSGEVSVKSLRDAGSDGQGIQQRVAIDRLIEFLEDKV